MRSHSLEILCELFFYKNDGYCYSLQDRKPIEVNSSSRPEIFLLNENIFFDLIIRFLAGLTQCLVAGTGKMFT